MTNYGFHTAMQEAGIEVATTAVGDRYVNEELRKRGWRLGGEQSGHIIDLGFGPSGDGIASALLTLEALAGADLGAAPCDAQAAAAAGQHPRARAVTRSSPRWRPRWSRRRSERPSEALSGRGRVLVRASGTEPLIRVMVEAPSQEETEAVCAELCRVVEQALASV